MASFCCNEKCLQDFLCEVCSISHFSNTKKVSRGMQKLFDINKNE